MHESRQAALRLAGQGTWIPVAAAGVARPGWTPADPAPTGVPTVGVAAPGVAAAGVTYPAAFEPLIGTLIEPGATARWELAAAATLDAPTLNAILDPGTVDGVRLVVPTAGIRRRMT